MFLYPGHLRSDASWTSSGLVRGRVMGLGCQLSVSAIGISIFSVVLWNRGCKSSKEHRCRGSTYRFMVEPVMGLKLCKDVNDGARRFVVWWYLRIQAAASRLRVVAGMNSCLLVNLKLLARDALVWGPPSYLLADHSRIRRHEKLVVGLFTVPPGEVPPESHARATRAGLLE